MSSDIKYPFMTGPEEDCGDGYARTNHSLGRRRSIPNTHEEEAAKPSPHISEGLSFKEKMASDDLYDDHIF